MTKLAPTNEILGSILANATGQSDELKADPKAYIYSNYNLELLSDIQILENTDKQIHLTLPYYSTVDKVTAERQNDEQIDVAGGFEIWFLALVAGGATAFLGVTAGIVVGGVDATVGLEGNK